MFPIRIGTLIPAEHAAAMAPDLNAMGFECYELNYPPDRPIGGLLDELPRALDAFQGRPISALACYGNTLTDPQVRRNLESLIDSAPKAGVGVVAMFAGSLPGASVPDMMDECSILIRPLARRAEDNGVKLALEGCAMGATWRGGGGMNLAYCPDAWDLLFDEVDCGALGLEWEPCHAYEQLMDPIPQLRRYAKRVYHVHCKDATVAWDVLREHGLDSPHPFIWNRTPGFGDTNWNDVFTILMQNGYEGFADIEGYHDPVYYNDLEWSGQLRALEYLKDCRGGRVYTVGPKAYRGYRG
ncbi:MAG: sugar phosphate isomerase/epimerase [Oscillospiraceae bacterium]|jgi:sugar phosphate isomerase/epimerase|nr:sugar phosphate isomerase/epimerase [Oscillospiraceae bacterium]